MSSSLCIVHRNSVLGPSFRHLAIASSESEYTVQTQYINQHLGPTTFCIQAITLFLFSLQHRQELT